MGLNFSANFLSTVAKEILTAPLPSLRSLDTSWRAAQSGFTMSNDNTCCGRVSPYLLSLLRIVAAILFMQHGAQKLLGYPPGGAKVELMTLAGVSGILELVGGAFILFGLLTRPVAFILSGEMAVAYFKVHAPGGFWPIQNHGELAVVYCFVFLYLAAAGAGPLSIDALRKKS
jgi:putative oxidoreductase